MVAAYEHPLAPIAVLCLAFGLGLLGVARAFLRSLRRERKAAPDTVPSTAQAWAEVLWVLLACAGFGVTLCSGAFLFASP